MPTADRTRTAADPGTWAVMTLPATTAPGDAEQTLRWLADRREAHRFEVDRVPFAQLGDWSFQPGTGNLAHRSGKFFTVEGLRVRSDYGHVPAWDQPIINQPEIGTLGFIIKEFDGVPHCLAQAKMEPGNVNTVQLSPTVQATRSNFTQVHQGARPRYVEYFSEPGRAEVLVDVLQSEQGSWFFGKRNRNMVVRVEEDIPPHPDFRWVTFAEIHALLRRDNVVNMDARTVLSCIPFGAPETPPRLGPDAAFKSALRRSMTPGDGALHPTRSVLSWFTDRTSWHQLSAERVPLAEIEGWRQDENEIRHADDRHFTIFGARVRAGSREVTSWTQPLLFPRGLGVAAFLVKRIDGVLHILLHARPEAGHLHTVEMAPTVQCTPSTYRDLPAGQQPRFLADVLKAPRRQVRFDAVQSEEGGRFHHAQSRYLIVEAGDGFPLDVPEGYRWVTAAQITGLLQHSHYLNVQARTLVAGLRGLW